MVGRLNGVIGSFASEIAGQQGKGRSRKNVGVMYKAFKSSFARNKKHGKGKKGKLFSENLRKWPVRLCVTLKLKEWRKGV